MHSPTVDVVIPAYNAEEFIVAAIDSVRSQTYPRLRIIVVDDGSTDRTGRIVQRKAAGDPSIHYVYKENGGLSSARNKGLSECTANFVAFLDADDIWTPTKLSEQMSVFDETNDMNLGLVYCDYSLIDLSGEIILNSRPFHIAPKLRGSLFDRLLKANRISGSGSGVLIRKSCFDDIGMFDENLPTCEDWDMWLRIARHYTFDYVPSPLVRIRRHGNNMQGNIYKMLTGYVMFFNKWISEAATRPDVICSWRRDFLPPMIVAIIRDLPRTTLFRQLNATMSPEVRYHTTNHRVDTVKAVLSAIVRKLARR